LGARALEKRTRIHTHMHYRFLVTCELGAAENSAEAREYVFDTLQEEGFCGEGRWSCGMADWFVIGGRWSGELSRASWAKEITSQMHALEQELGVQVWGAFYGSAEKERIQQELAAKFQQMWDNAAPDGYTGIPYCRDTYQQNGYEDDAMLLTQELYDALLKEYEGKEEFEHHSDLEYDEVSPAMIGKKWLVVVDYHN
jgi:hypothetical protein